MVYFKSRFFDPACERDQGKQAAILSHYSGIENLMAVGVYKTVIVKSIVNKTNMVELLKRIFPECIKKYLRKPYLCINDFIHPMPAKQSNVEYNRALWNRYARSWNKKNAYIENECINDEGRIDYLQYLGDEWGNVDDTQQVIDDYISPYLSVNKIVAEIGVGGARIASKTVTQVKELHCFDISAEMLKKAKKTLSNHANVYFTLLQQPQFPDECNEKFDFLYSFDVFVHIDLHTIWKYFQEINRVLKPGGRAFIHTTNVTAPDGWEKFSSQDQFSVEGLYFISPEIIHLFAQKSNLDIIKSSATDASNFYYNRDYLVILGEKA